VNIPSASADHLIFGWEKPRRGNWALTGFLLGSLAVHALGFYLFQIIYPPAVALLPPPGRVSLIAPNSGEGLLLLRWLEAEDPALASNTQLPAAGKSLTMPTIQHAPSYLARQSPLKKLPPVTSELAVPSAHPPGPVERAAPRTQPVTTIVPTVVRFSPELEKSGPVQSPNFKFNASGQTSAAQAAQFRIAVNEKGEVRYCFLQSSAGNPALDEQVRKYLALCRFPPSPDRSGQTADNLIWGMATVEWGNDIASAPALSPEIAP
jgi:hypothetical protein